MRGHIESRNDHKARGQSLIEFALLAPVLFLLLTGVLDIGRAYYAYVAIINAAREGARAAVLDPTNQSNIKSHAELESNSVGVTITDSMIQIECAPAGSSSYTSDYCSATAIVTGDQVRVMIIYPFQLVTGSVLGLGSLPMSGSAVMAISIPSL